MKKRYQISILEVNNFVQRYYEATLDNSENSYSQNSSKVKKHLFKFFDSYKKGDIIDGERLSQLFFPTSIKERFNIFISHSGGDKDIVEKFANTIEVLGGHCFVDWMVWGNLKELQHKVDDVLCEKTERKDGGTTYSYYDRNYTTAHTHAMLSMALLDMIDQCDICIVVTSKNSTIPGENFGEVRTLSPWIYEEVSYMNHLAKENEKDKVRLYDSRDSNINISHSLDLKDFEKLTSSKLIRDFLLLND